MANFFEATLNIIYESALFNIVEKALRAEPQRLRRATEAEVAHLGQYYLFDVTTQHVAKTGVNLKQLAEERALILPDAVVLPDN